MKNQDPILEVLKKMADEVPVKLQPIIQSYQKNGIDGLSETWKKIIQEAIDENQ